jgi:hypothetical protein
LAKTVTKTLVVLIDNVDPPCARHQPALQAAGEKGITVEVAAALRPRAQPHREVVVADEAPLGMALTRRTES